MKKCELLIEERNKYKEATEGRKILARKKAEKKIEQLFEDMTLDFKEMEKELKHQKKNPTKFPDIQTKTKILELLKKKLNILKSKYEDEDYNQDEYSQNENQIQTLENYLSSQQMEGNYNKRDIYEEEENKIDEWNKRIKQQDEQLDEIHKGVGKIKQEAGTAGIGINKIGKKFKGIDKHVDKTQKKVISQNTRLKEFLTKLRSKEKICCDILLILILLGLIFTLYSVIKHRF